MIHEMMSTTHILSKYEKKLGVRGLSDELELLLDRHVFTTFYIISPIDARADFKV